LFDDVDFDSVLDQGEYLATISGGSSFQHDLTLSEGRHNLRSLQVDSAGNISAVSDALSIKVDTTAPMIQVTSVVQNKNGSYTVTGLSEPNTSISVIENKTFVGSITTTSNGSWNFMTPKLSNGTHNITASATDLAGNSALYGSDGSDTLVGTSGFDRVVGGSGRDTITGAGNSDTFVFGSGFGKDVITDFDQRVWTTISSKSNRPCSLFSRATWT
jgi:Ca2+-binding RTX toxin-like protein